jgi:nucleolar protein 14
MMMVITYFCRVLMKGDIKEDVVRQDHFGGNFEDEEKEEREKTKAEVMAELISKSKMYKYERQQQHDEDLEEIEELDANLGELQQLLGKIQTKREPVPKSQEMISYDAALREMVYDKRSKPSERTKTEEEIAQEESERLEKLEQERLNRMMGEEVDAVDGAVQNLRPRREGDDLDDDFIPDQAEEDLYGLGKGADENDKESSAEMDNDGEVHEDDEEESEDDFDLAEYFTDEEQNIPEPLNESEEETIIPATKRLRLSATSTSQEIAYTFPCPSTFEEMLDIIKDIPTSSIPTVIERIEILHSTKLLPTNREKLEVHLI